MIIAMLPAAAAGRRAAARGWCPGRTSTAAFFEALQVERNVMFLILTLIILVAALNIVSGLIMLVKDKSPDIAILRTMGATRGAVMRVFLIAGASIGVIGTLAGLRHRRGVLRQYRKHPPGPVAADRHARCSIPPSISCPSMPAEMDPGEVTAVVVMALALTFLATLYPSWRAARLDPVEALRYE